MKNEGDILRLIRTGDGSYSIWNSSLDETYHSRHGALTESLHVFIREGFEYLQTQGRLQVLEVGYGTGLNAWLTAIAAAGSGIPVKYTALEPAPPPRSLCIKPESYGHSPEENTWWDSLFDAPWDQHTVIHSLFEIEKIRTGIESWNPETLYDLVYFDAFAPAYQPELWETEVFEKLFGIMKSQAVFVTYCAKGSVKRILQQVGFTVQTLPGPPGKREMTRARKP